jgi:hypothetical protein
MEVTTLDSNIAVSELCLMENEVLTSKINFLII